MTFQIQPIGNHEVGHYYDQLTQTPYFSSMSYDEVKVLLENSIVAHTSNDRLSENRGHLMEYSGMAGIDISGIEISIPIFVLSGGLKYWGHTVDYPHSGFHAGVRAPFITFDNPIDLEGTADDYEVSTVENTTIIIFNPFVFEQVLENNPSMYKWILKDRNRLNILFARWFTILSAPTASIKVARLLKTYAAHTFADRGVHEVTNLSQDHIAQLLFLSRASVAKCVSKMVRFGAVETGYRRIGVNIEAVQKYIDDEVAGFHKKLAEE